MDAHSWWQKDCAHICLGWGLLLGIALILVGTQGYCIM